MSIYNRVLDGKTIKISIPEIILKCSLKKSNIEGKIVLCASLTSENDILGVNMKWPKNAELRISIIGEEVNYFRTKN